jgi:hypothetical protein
VDIDGDLTAEDASAFRSKIAPYAKGVVAFDSLGGSLGSGLEIGRTIRLRNFATWVPDGMRCASACALAWLGGTPRYMGKHALIGFHAAYRMGSDGPAETGKGNAMMGKYLSDLGLSYSAVAYISSASPDSMTWMTKDDADRLGIEVSLLEPKTKTPATSATPRHSTDAQLVAVMRRKTAEHLVALYSALSGLDESALKMLGSVYADSVEYYGKLLSRDEVVRQTTRFIERWPQRQYKPRARSVEIQCDAATFACSAKGTLDFDARSPARNEHSFGAATFEYTFNYALTPGVPKITKEAGSVVERHKESLAPTIPGWDQLMLR